MKERTRWEMLTDKERAEFISEFNDSAVDRSFNDGYNMALMSVFGHHNLTAKAEEAKQADSNPRTVTENDKTSTAKGVYFADCESNGAENHIVQNNGMVNYRQYSLDLAKELAMIKARKQDVLMPSDCDIIVDAVKWIVKRLKETEI